MSGEVPVPEGDEAKSLTQEELGQGQEDHCLFNHGSPYMISVFHKDTGRDVWFLDQVIWMEEHKSKDDFEKPVEECKDPKCRNHTVKLYKGLSNQRITDNLYLCIIIFHYEYSLWNVSNHTTDTFDL